MNLSTPTLLLTISTLAACGPRSKPKPLQPVEQVRYLATPTSPCVRKPIPPDPIPPKCSPLDRSIQTKCSDDELREWDASIYDHRDKLIRWADYVWFTCGPVTE